LETKTKQLTLLRDIFEISSSCSTQTYIWGGLVPDILVGSFLREHGDIDGFTLNLWECEDEMAARYKERGYQVSHVEEVDFLRIEKGEVHAVFNQLAFDGETALWHHAGKEGTVYFPKQWLSNTPQDFYDTKVYISGIEFEYAIKICPQLLHPEWKGRDKDITHGSVKFWTGIEKCGKLTAWQITST